MSPPYHSSHLYLLKGASVFYIGYIYMNVDSLAYLVPLMAFPNAPVLDNKELQTRSVMVPGTKFTNL